MPILMSVTQDIHMATVGLGTSSKREEVIDFSTPLMDGGVYMLQRAKLDGRDSFFFMKPFTTSLW